MGDLPAGHVWLEGKISSSTTDPPVRHLVSVRCSKEFVIVQAQKSLIPQVQAEGMCLDILDINLRNCTSGAGPVHLGACMYVSVCENHLKRCKTSKFRRGTIGTLMAWANEGPSKLLRKRTCNFWIVMGCGQPKNHYAVFQRESHQDFWIQHMNGWRWLLLYLSAQLAQSETAVNLLSTPIFCLYFGVSPGFYWFDSILRWRRKNFPFTPHQTPSCSCQM